MNFQRNKSKWSVARLILNPRRISTEKFNKRIDSTNFILIVIFVYLIYYGIFIAISMFDDEIINKYSLELNDYIYATTITYASFAFGVYFALSNSIKRCGHEINCYPNLIANFVINALYFLMLYSYGPFLYGENMNRVVAVANIFYATYLLILVSTAHGIYAWPVRLFAPVLAFVLSLYLKDKAVLLLVWGFYFCKYIHLLTRRYRLVSKILIITIVVYASAITSNIYTSLRDSGDFSAILNLGGIGEFVFLNLSNLEFMQLHNNRQLDWIEPLGDLYSILPMFIRPDIDTVAVQYSKYVYGSNYQDGFGFGLNPYNFLYLETSFWAVPMAAFYGCVVGFILSKLQMIARINDDFIMAIVFIVLVLTSRGGAIGSLKQAIIISLALLIITRFSYFTKTITSRLQIKCRRS